MPIRRTRIIGGERFLKNRHGKSTGINLAIKIVKDTRKNLKEAVELKDKLIKEANEEWKKSVNYKPRRLTGIRLQKFLSSRENYKKHLYYFKWNNIFSLYII